MNEIEKAQHLASARKIAAEVDPQAGGFFRRSLERAALLGITAGFEGGALVADTFARANLNLNATEPEATIAGSTATAIAQQIRNLKS